MKVKEIIFIVEEDPEGGYNARALGESIFTEGTSLDELKENIKDAIKCHFDKEEDVPDIIRLRIVKEETFKYA
ncbi:2-oxoisovalerate dehydrogenase [Petrotoga halophila]|uniref:2-oxoisovalerate dehydrogenase n=1 Tax=Petrotoga halophila DSM 16923 TaxID=1122953 RepID=A0A2S5E9B0_9BACT|nr:2-oxoisovalerate dehydrogenase [Petrotoga halophila]POZ89682.1 2-oxoisovalerate dehydrogenase [Petrotoga halophila DSM 16923]